MNFDILKAKEFQKIILIFLIIKIIIIATGFAAYNFIPEEYAKRQRITDSDLLNPWAQYDGNAYLDIAKNGYNSDFLDGTSNYGWYPLYPVLIKLFSFIGYDLAAFLISNVASFLAVAYLFLLFKTEHNETITKKAILYILLFPTAYFMTMMYTESLFLLFSVACFYYAKKDKWLLVGILGFLASLTRLQGAILFFPMIYIYFKKYGFRFKNIKFLCIFIIPLGVLAFMFYHYAITGDAFIQFYTQGKFGRHFALPWEGLGAAISTIPAATNIFITFYNIFNIFMVISFLALIIIFRKKMNNEYTIYAVINMMPALFSSTLAAVSRFNLMLFPVFLLLAKLGHENKKIDTALKIIFILSAVLMLLFTVRHVNTFLKGIDF